MGFTERHALRCGAQFVLDLAPPSMRQAVQRRFDQEVEHSIFRLGLLRQAELDAVGYKVDCATSNVNANARGFSRTTAGG